MNNTPKIDKTTGREALTPSEKRKQRDQIDQARERKAHELVKDATVSWKNSLEINRGEEAESDEIQEVVRHHRKGNKAA